VDELRKAAESAKQVLENKRLRADEHMIAIVVDDLRQALEQWDTSDMAHHSGGLSVEQTEKQEPVAWLSQGGDVSRSKKHFEEMGFNSAIPLYTAPFNWVGIAIDEIPSLWGNADADLWLFAQAIEDKLKDRNT
jgi:hypothetical protein